MKGLIAAALLAIGAVVALQGGSNDAAHSQDSQLEQGVHRFDSVLQKGLSQETHDELAQTANSSAQWLRGVGDTVESATQ